MATSSRTKSGHRKSASWKSGVRTATEWLKAREYRPLIIIPPLVGSLLCFITWILALIDHATLDAVVTGTCTLVMLWMAWRIYRGGAS